VTRRRRNLKPLPTSGPGSSVQRPLMAESGRCELVRSRRLSDHPASRQHRADLKRRQSLPTL